MDNGGALKPIEAQARRSRRQRLEELGGPPVP